MRKYIYLALLLLIGTASTFAQTVSYTENTANTVVFERENTTYNSSKTSYFRCPAITKMQDGSLYAVSDMRIGGTGDIGTGINTDIVAKKSTDNGKTWSALSVAVKGESSSGFDYAHSDPAIVTDKETGKMLLLCTGGTTGFSSGGCLLGQYTSSDNGSSWTGGEITSNIKAAFTSAGPTISKQFFTSGRIIQSSKVKVGTSYRIYSAMCTSGGSVVMYSDDFGSNWAVLGSKVPYSKGDETVLEELPNGDLLLSAKTSSTAGRTFAVYNYSDLTTATGSWNSSTATGLTDATYCNAEMLLVPTSNSNYYVLLHSVCLNTTGVSYNRENVTVYYKLINTTETYNTPSYYSTGWNKLNQMSSTQSAYSSMVLDKNGNVAYIFEDNRVSSSVESYDMTYVNFTVNVTDITQDQYNVTCNTATGGKVTSDAYLSKAKAGDLVTLTVSPNGAYELDALTVTDGSGNAVTVSNDNTFTMPSNDVTVSATFKVSGDVTYTVNANNGTFGHGSCSSTSSTYSCIWTSTANTPTLTLSCYSSSDELANNMKDEESTGTSFYAYTMNASPWYSSYELSVPEGYKIVSYSFDYTKSSDNVTVRFEDGTSYTSGETVTVNAQTAPRFTINSATDAAMKYLNISNFIVVIAPVSQYTITCNSGTGGTVSATSPAYEGSTVTMTVTPDTGYELNALTVTDGSENEVTVTDNTFTMPSSNVTVTATWKKVTKYTYIVSASKGSLSNISSTSTSFADTWTSTQTSPTTLTMKSYNSADCTTQVNDIEKSSFNLYSGKSYTAGYQLSVGDGYQIVSYSFEYTAQNSISVTVDGDSYTSGSTVSPNSQTCIFVVKGSNSTNSYITPSNFTVTVSPVEYAITYNLNDGTNSADNPSTYTIEDEVTLADPTKTGYIFTGWTYDGQTEPTKSVTITKGTTGNLTYTANWESKYTPDPANHNVTINAIVGTATDTEVSEALSALGTSKTDNTLVYDETGTYSGSTKNVVVKNGDTYTCKNLVLTDKVDVSIPTAFTATSATYSRSMGTSNWGTICLPFAPKASGVTFYTLQKESDKTDGTGILAFTAVENPQANVPYVFRTDITESTISNTNCSVAATVGVDLSNESAGWTLKGTYNRIAVNESGTATATNIVDPNTYYIKSNKFYKINELFNLSAFRAYFSAASNGNSNPAKALVFSIEEYYETDAINTLLNPEDEVVGYFNADGMEMNNIQKGLNIIKYKSGKIVKIMIK